MAKLWWIRDDPFGMLSALFTLFLLGFAQVVMTKIVLLPWLGVDIHLILFTSCTLLSLIAHTRSQFSDPGAIPSYFLPPELPGDIELTHIAVRPHNAPKICRSCRTLKSHQTYHCKTCARCIVRMDHHCPWINNCVGIFNQKFFLLFLIYTGLSCLYCAGLLIARFHSCTSNPKMCTISGISTVLCILTFIEALVFGLFVIIMFFDQLSGIFHEVEFEQQHFKTLLMQYEDAERGGQRVFSPPPIVPPNKTQYEMLKDIFGGSFGLNWLSPFHAPQGAYDKYKDELDSTHNHAETVTVNFVKYVRAENMKDQQLQQQQRQPQSNTQATSSSSHVLAATDTTSSEAVATAEYNLQPQDFESSSSADPGDGDSNEDGDGDVHSPEVASSELRRRLSAPSTQLEAMD